MTWAISSVSSVSSVDKSFETGIVVNDNYILQYAFTPVESPPGGRGAVRGRHGLHPALSVSRPESCPPLRPHRGSGLYPRHSGAHGRAGADGAGPRPPTR